MAITVKHSKVSTIPDTDDTSLVRPSDWNADHTLVGLGTMAEQNANAVAITGGTISGVTIPASNITGTLTVPNGGTGATTLTGYVKGAGTTALTASSTIPNTDITGLGTASTKDAGVALGVATLDSAGKVPISQIPDSVIGALSYQGTWNASTNTPTLTSSVGTKGYYYVVSVAGSTNLNGITDWKIGDWAVYSGTAWQKIDNTDSVTSVNGYTGAVTLTYTDVGAFPATSTTGTGNVVLATGATQANPTISNYENFTPTTAPSYSEGRVWYDSTEKALAYYNDSSSLAVHISQDLIFKVINNTGSTIPNGSPVYITGTSSGQTYPNVALAKADAAATSAVIGLTNGAIANGATGYVSSQGTIDNVNTSTFTVGQVLYLSPYSAGQLMNTIPPTGITVQVGVATYIDSSAGHIYVKQTTPLSVPASIITGTLGVDHGGTGATTLTGYVKGSGTSAMTASSTIPTTDLSGTITNAQLANSAITINGTSTSLGGSISVGTVTSVTGTSPVVSSGGTTPAISMPAATSSVSGYLTSTDWNTFNNKGSGTVTSVSATAPITSSGGDTPNLAMPAATGSVNGYLTSTDWTTFNGKQATLVSGTNIKTINTNSILGSGDLTISASPAGSTTQVQYNNAGALGASSAFTYSGTTLTAPTVSSSNGVFSTPNGSLGAGNATRFKNRIINGNMYVAQRATSATLTAGGTIANGYATVDRFYGYCTGANVTMAQVAGTGNNKNLLRFTGAASVTAIGCGQRIEAINSYDLAGSTATLSVYLSNSLLTSVTWTAYYANTTDTFGTLASPTRTQIATGTFTVTSTLTQYNAQISVPSAATTGIEIVFTVGAQTSGTFNIGLVQLELGGSATGFDYVDYTTQLAMCQRYYQIYTKPVGRGVAGINLINRVGLSLQVQMRTSPTLTMSGTLSWFDGGNTGTATALSAAYSTINSIEFDAATATGTPTAGFPAILYITSTVGSLIATAEL